MSLNFFTADIADQEFLSRWEGDREMWSNAVESYVHWSMVTGINPLTEENYTEWYRRYITANLAIGTPPAEVYLSLRDVRKLIGMSTNVTTLTPAAFAKKIRETMERNARETVEGRLSDLAKTDAVEAEILDDGDLISDLQHSYIWAYRARVDENQEWTVEQGSQFAYDVESWTVNRLINEAEHMIDGGLIGWKANLDARRALEDDTDVRWQAFEFLKSKGITPSGPRALDLMADLDAHHWHKGAGFVADILSRRK